MQPEFARINIITGHYGSGKTNLSINFALTAAKEGRRVRLMDLDIVNPYFRAADCEDMLRAHGVEVIRPVYANTNLDLPSIPADAYSIFGDRESTVIIDVGGDDAGAAALGRFSAQILQDDFRHFSVVNARRSLTQTPQEAVEILREIERACRVPVTHLVNNTHLCGETTAQVVEASIPYAEEVAREAGLPLALTTAPAGLQVPFPHYPVEIFVKAPW